MKTQITAVVLNMLNESSRYAKQFIKYESNGWGSPDTLRNKFTAQCLYGQAMMIAREFKIDTSEVISDSEWLNAAELPKSQYEN